MEIFERFSEKGRFTIKAPPGGLEPPTPGLGIPCSIRLSYGGNRFLPYLIKVFKNCKFAQLWISLYNLTKNTVKESVPEVSGFERFAKSLFEVCMLKRILRTGYAYLGTGSESVAAHSFGVVFCAWLLGSLEPAADVSKVIKMAILHDLAEARIGDLNSVNKLYDRADEFKAFKDALRGLPFEEEAIELLKEYQEGKSLEARLAHDADQLDLMAMLKEQKDLGNPYAPRWLYYAKKRLKTDVGRRLAEALLETDWASWWLDHFVSRDETA